MRIPEGSAERDFNGRKLVAGRLGKLELYVSWVWKGRRYLYIAGSWRGPLPFWKRLVWFRRTSWYVLNCKAL